MIAFLNKRRIATDEINAERMGCLVKRQGIFDVILIVRSSGNQGNRRYRDALVDDRNSVFFLNLFTDLDEILGLGRDFVVNLPASFVAVRVDAVKQ